FDGPRAERSGPRRGRGWHVAGAAGPGRGAGRGVRVMREPDRRDRSAGAGQPAATAVHREAPVRVRVRVPATTANLGPGFDTLGMALALYNYFELETAPQGCHVEAVGTSAERIPVGEDNLVVRAARAVWE